MTLVPALTPVTSPVLLTVATEGVAEPQVDPAVGAEPVNCVVEPAHTDKVPVMVGSGLIVTDNCVAAFKHPVKVTVSVTFNVPVPAAPQFTVIELPVPEVGVPPVTVHA